MIGKLVKTYILKEEFLNKGYMSYYKACDSTDQTQQIKYLCAVIQKSLLSSKPELDEKVQKHIALMTTFTSPYISKVLDGFHSPNTQYILYKYYEEGNLQDIFQKKGITNFAEADCIRYFKQLMEAFKEIRSKNIIHRNLIPSSILFEGDHIVLSGFFSSKQTDRPTTTVIGYPYYFAPEVMENDSYDDRVDIWGLGIIYYYMVFGVQPWSLSKTIDLKGVFERIRKGGLTIPSSSVVSAQTVELIKKMLCVEPNQRISWDEMYRYYDTSDRITNSNMGHLSLMDPGLSRMPENGRNPTQTFINHQYPDREPQRYHPDNNPVRPRDIGVDPPLPQRYHPDNDVGRPTDREHELKYLEAQHIKSDWPSEVIPKNVQKIMGIDVGSITILSSLDLLFSDIQKIENKEIIKKLDTIRDSILTPAIELAKEIRRTYSSSNNQFKFHVDVELLYLYPLMIVCNTRNSLENNLKKMVVFSSNDDMTNNFSGEAVLQAIINSVNDIIEYIKPYSAHNVKLTNVLNREFMIDIMSRLEASRGGIIVPREHRNLYASFQNCNRSINDIFNGHFL